MNEKEHKVNMLFDIKKDVAYIVCPQCGQLILYVQGTPYHKYFPCICGFFVKNKKNI